MAIGTPQETPQVKPLAKGWWKSKAVWLSVCIIIGAIAEFIQGLPTGASFATLMAGILSIIIRFLTNQPLSGTPGAKKNGVK